MYPTDKPPTPMPSGPSSAPTPRPTSPTPIPSPIPTTPTVEPSTSVPTVYDFVTMNRTGFILTMFFSAECFCGLCFLIPFISIIINNIKTKSEKKSYSVNIKKGFEVDTRELSNIDVKTKNNDNDIESFDEYYGNNYH
jgi:hypothetical protein